MDAMSLGYNDALMMPTSERRYHLMKKVQQRAKQEAELEQRKQQQSTQTGKGKKVIKTNF